MIHLQVIFRICLMMSMGMVGFSIVSACGLDARADDVVDTTGGRLQLIVGNVAQGTAHLGLAIDLKPGWHTYWRYPGDSGVPPDLTTETADNISGFRVDYPAPRRFSEAGDQTIGYTGKVTLLVDAALTDPSKSAFLTLHVRLGVCKEICVPVDTTLTASIDPALPAPPQAASEIRAAAGKVPVSITAGADMSVVKVSRDEQVKPQLVTLAIKAKPDELTDVFVEGPETWALPLPTKVSVSTDQSLWRFALDGISAGAALTGTELRVTIVGTSQSTVQTITLP